MELKIQEKISLAKWTWWKVGGDADFYCAPNSPEEALAACKWAKDRALPVTILSGGSNVLISDLGVEGLLIHMSQMRGMKAEMRGERFVVECGAGTPKHEVMRVFMEKKLSPAIFLAGLPGDIGGGIAMNAGVSENRIPREFCEIVDWIDVVKSDSNNTLRIISIESKNLQWSYRKCSGFEPGVIVAAGLSWPNEPISDLLNTVKLANQNRLSRQPLDLPSGGSTFKNPLPHFAGKLIEKSGLKGFRIGDAQVSEKHANFIVNLGQAKASEIKTVLRHVQDTVKAREGVTLEPEVHFLGRW